MKLTEQEQVVMKAVAHAAKTHGGHIAYIPDVIRALSYPKATTKRILESLAWKDAVTLHRHDHPASLTPAERKVMIRSTNGQIYYHAVAINSAEKQNGRRRNRTVIKAKRVTVLSANPGGARTRNKAARLSEADISRLPAHIQEQLRRQQSKVEEKEAKAITPAQKKAAVKARRSFLARLGTRLRVIGQTKKIKVSARDLGRCPRKTIKVRARHETDALAQARAKLGSRFDDFKVANGRRRNAGVRKRKNSFDTPCLYCGGPDGQLPGAGHSTTCSRYRKPLRKVRAIRRKKKGNPIATSSNVRAMREKFTGTKSRKTAVLTAPNGTPRNLAKLGKLILIKAKKATIKPSAKNPAGTVWLCADAKGKLHLCTTNQRLIDGPAQSFGEVSQIEYEACKPHLGHPRPTIFFHKMGEEGGSRPELVADGQGGLKFKGGSYSIGSEGIRN